MQLSDNITNSDILVIYVEEFKHLDQGTKEFYGGHPIAKRVYRAIHNRDTDTYRILYTQGKQASAFSLPCMADATDLYKYHLVELNKRNIADFNITEEDLDKIIGWADHKDLKKVLTEGRVRAAVDDGGGLLSELAGHMIKAMEEDDAEVFKRLSEYSVQYFTSLEDLSEHLMKGGQLSIENMSLSTDDVFGPGINIGCAQQAIYKYTNDHRRDPNDLLVAIEHLLTEYSRVTFE